MTVEQVCIASAQMFLISFENLVNQNFHRQKPNSWLPITSRGTVRLSVTIGPKQYDNEFHVLIDTEADCFVGFDFLRIHKCDLLFSKKLFCLDSKKHVPFYHEKLNLETNTVFWVRTTETVSVPARHAIILPARRQKWKRPLTENSILFKPVA